MNFPFKNTYLSNRKMLQLITIITSILLAAQTLAAPIQQRHQRAEYNLTRLVDGSVPIKCSVSLDHVSQNLSNWQTGLGLHIQFQQKPNTTNKASKICKSLFNWKADVYKFNSEFKKYRNVSSSVSCNHTIVDCSLKITPEAVKNASLWVVDFFKNAAKLNVSAIDNSCKVYHT